MKTNQEIQAEAREMTALASNFLEGRITTNATSSSDDRMRFQFSTNLSPGVTQRHVEAEMVGGALVFRLIQQETNPSDLKREQSAEGTLLASSPSAYEVLSTGYETAEEERLVEQLESYTKTNRDAEYLLDRETVSSVEHILESFQLGIADQMRTKAEIVEFLGGRLEPGDLISRNIERQRVRETISERHEMKLTVGEP
ncbi:MAG: hypothetical protein QM760_21015 [Nibricoccus sp.]